MLNRHPARGVLRRERGSRGFTLIELMIAIALIAILTVLGMPSLSAYLQNAKLRSTTETFYSGLQMARAEAVRRNSQVQFVLTTDDPIPFNQNTTNTAATAKNWMVRVPSPTAPGTYTFVEGKAMAEGATGQTSSTQGVQIDTGGLSTVTFTGFGATTLGGAATFAFTNPTGGSCAPSGAMRCLNVVVSIGGQVKMCDPAVTAVGDTRRC